MQLGEMTLHSEHNVKTMEYGTETVPFMGPKPWSPLSTAIKNFEL